MQDSSLHLAATMKLLITSFVAGIYSLVAQTLNHNNIIAIINFDQQSLLAWSATITAVISGFCLAMIPVYQRIKQAKRDEEIKDSVLCQAKLDEALARIKALALSVRELTEISANWEALAKSSNQNLNKAVSTLEEINTGLKNE